MCGRLLTKPAACCLTSGFRSNSPRCFFILTLFPFYADCKMKIYKGYKVFNIKINIFSLQERGVRLSGLISFRQPPSITCSFIILCFIVYFSIPPHSHTPVFLPSLSLAVFFSDVIYFVSGNIRGKKKDTHTYIYIYISMAFYVYTEIDINVSHKIMRSPIDGERKKLNKKYIFKGGGGD